MNNIELIQINFTQQQLQEAVNILSQAPYIKVAEIINSISMQLKANDEKNKLELEKSIKEKLNKDNKNQEE